MTKSRLLAAASALTLLALAPASAQELLPNGQQQFTDANGAPLGGGQVFFYIPNTTTPKTTYQDQAETVPNTDPVNLNSAGRATIWGTGTYREIVYDVNGNLVWDQLTSGEQSTSSISVGGDLSGTTSNAQVIATHLAGPLPVGQGGTGLSSGTSGGVPCFSSGSGMSSSALLAQDQVVLGGGVGTCPATMASAGTSTQVLHGGTPAWGAVNLTTDVTGVLPVANGGTGGAGGVGTIGAWARVTAGSSPSIVTGANVGTVVWNSTGNYTITWTTPIGSTNYTIFVNGYMTSGTNNRLFTRWTSQTSAAVTIQFVDITGGVNDPDAFSIMAVE